MCGERKGEEMKKITVVCDSRIGIDRAGDGARVVIQYDGMNDRWFAVERLGVTEYAPNTTSITDLPGNE